MAKQNCDKNCLTCGQEQRSYCAVQMAKANQELLMSLLQEVREMKDSGANLIAPQFSPVREEETEPTDSGAVAINE